MASDLFVFTSLHSNEQILSTCLLSFVPIWTSAHVKLVLHALCGWITVVVCIISGYRVAGFKDLLCVHVEMLRYGCTLVLYRSVFWGFFCNEILMKW